MQSSIEAFESLEQVQLGEFGSYFSSFRKEAFRFEMLPVYDVPQEKEYIKKFQNGISCPADFNSDWLNLIKEAQVRGSHFTRVRFVPLQHITPYLQFEINWGYKRSSATGESIFILNDKTLDPYSQVVPILNDFWLFDQAECFIMYYDQVGRFLGVNRVPKKDVALYTNLANFLLENSTPFLKSYFFDGTNY